MAINYENEGNLNRAEQLYRQAKVNFEEAGDRSNTAPLLATSPTYCFSEAIYRKQRKHTSRL
jgi:hypothetical protein